MPFVMPTQIDQINDYSHLAGRQVIDALQKQGENNPWDKAKNLLDTYLKNRDNAQIAEAIAQYNQGIESGLSAVQALAGIDSWIAGSDKFREQADKIRDSRIQQTSEERAEAKWAKEQADAARLLQSSALSAGFQEAYNKLGTAGAAAFFQDHQDEIRANPTAYNQVISLASSLKVPLFQSTASTKATPFTRQELEHIRDNIAIAKDKANVYGIFDDIASGEEKYKSDEAFAADYIKMAGLSGAEAEDQRQNIFEALADLRAQMRDEKIYLPDTVARVLIGQNMYTPWAASIPFVGKYAQAKGDVDAAMIIARSLGKNYQQYETQYRNAEEMEKAYNEVAKNITDQQIQRDTYLSRVDEMVQKGELSRDQGERIKANIISQYNQNFGQLINRNSVVQDILRRAQVK